MPYSPTKKSSCIKMYDSKGKPAGLMAEGSMAYMESMGQEKSNLMQDMPIDNRGVGEMSPYKMDSGSPAKKTNLDEFGNPIPEGFKADAGEVTGTVRRVSDKPIRSKDTGYATYPTVRDVEGKSIPGAGRYLSMEVERGRVEGSRPPSYKNIIPKGNIKDVAGRSAEKFLTVEAASPGSKKISFTRPIFKNK
jgi:hypothetical protein